MPSTQWCESICLVERHAATKLMDELRERRLRVARARARAATILRTSHAVQSVGRAHSSGGERRDEVGEAPELLLGEHAGFGTLIRFGVIIGCLLLVFGVVEVQVDETVEVTGPAVRRPGRC